MVSAGNSWGHSTMWREERFKAGVCHTGDWKVADCNSPGGKEHTVMSLGLLKEQ